MSRTDRVFHEGADCAVVLCGDVLIQVWEGPAHNEVLQKVLAALKSLKAGDFRQRSLFMLNVVSERASPPDAEGRAIAAKFFEYFDFHVNVTEGTGFRAAIIRSVLVAITLLTRVRAKHAVADTVAAGAALLASAGALTSPRDLEAVVEEARHQLRAA